MKGTGSTDRVSVRNEKKWKKYHNRYLNGDRGVRSGAIHIGSHQN